MPDVFITHINGVPVDEAVNSIQPAGRNRLPRHMKTGLQGKKAAMLNAWVDLLGKSAQSGESSAIAKKVYISKSASSKVANKSRPEKAY
jgi:hypothetical protein